jgi:hypothetical protein
MQPSGLDMGRDMHAAPHHRLGRAQTHRGGPHVLVDAGRAQAGFCTALFLEAAALDALFPT